MTAATSASAPLDVLVIGVSLKLKIFLGFPITLAILFVAVFYGYPAIWRAQHPSTIWRYKITIQVKTPDGTKEFSAVRQAFYTPTPQFLFPDAGTSYSGLSRGEAIVMDFGKLGNAFALQRGNGIGDSYDGGLMQYVMMKYKKIPSGEVTLPIHLYPRIVRLKKEQVLTSIEVIYQPADYIFDQDRTKTKIATADGRTVFGTIEKVSLETSSDDITTKIEKFIPLERQTRNFVRWTRDLPYGDLRKIYPTDFKQ